MPAHANLPATGALLLLLVLPAGAYGDTAAALPPEAAQHISAFEERVQPIRAKYDAELAAIQAKRLPELNAERNKLVRRLKTLLVRVQLEGNLDDANSIRTVVDDLREAVATDRGTAVALDGLPAEAAKAVQSFEKGARKIAFKYAKRIEKIEGKRAKELKKVRRPLIKKLKAAIKSLVKKGDLEAANAIKAKIKALQRSAAGAQANLTPERWEVACWAGGWELYPATKMTVALTDRVLSATNTTGVHAHAMFLSMQRFTGDFRLEVEFRGAVFFLGLRVTSRSRGTLSHTLEGPVVDWQTLVIERVDGKVSATLGGRPITMKGHDKVRGGESVQFGFSLRRNQRIEIRSFDARTR